ncbi:MAG: tRNA ((7)-)-methyltransferase 2 [Betaproteobacteria bacterium]|nr:tRNA ((7)-)-methyltransferase 2 [Betaproteobacteria bacterium]
MQNTPEGAAPQPGDGQAETKPRLTTQSIRSFVLRQGRMSPAQTHALETLLPVYGIPYKAEPLDLAAAFGRSAPTILEIGFGMGETSARIAEAAPEKNFLGLEVHAPGVGALLKLIGAGQLTNLRIIQHDAVEVAQQMIAPGSLAGIHVFFPDPWPKARHHKRRLIQPAFVKLLASRLAPGGTLHCATDWEHYAQQMLEVLSAEAQLSNTATDPAAGGYAERPAYRPITKFENRGLKLGHGVWDVVFARKP